MKPAHFHPVRKVLLFFALMLFGVSANAQFDTYFWMPPIWDANVSSLNQPSELFITTPYPDPVNVYIRTPDFSTFVLDTVVSSGNPLKIPLTPGLGQTMLANTVITDNGFIIKSDAPIQAVHKVAGSLNQTLVTLKGRNGRGTDFWAGSQVRNTGGNYFPDEYHFISVMALEDNTSITMETPFNMYDVGGDLPNPYTITLNKYECYLIRGHNSAEHVTGSHITSDKKIVTISGSTHTQIAGGNAADGGTDQLVPIDLAGFEFVFVKGQNTNPFDYAIIVATEDNTDVYLDGGGTPVANINAGEFYDYTLTGSMGAAHYIQTSNPSYCYHVTGASNDDEVGMSAIPQIECTGSRYVEFSKFETNTTNQIMNVIFPPEAEETMMINGQHYSDVPGIIFNTIPGKPNWGALAIPQSSLLDDNILQSEGFFHAGFLTGNSSSTGTYGFLSGFDDAFEFLNPDNFLPTTIYTWGQLCQGQTIDHCLQVYSCADDHNIIAFEGNEGEVVVTPFTTPFDSCFSYTAPFDFVGSDTITFTVDNRFGFEGQMDVVFLVVDPDTPIDAGPVQELCSEFTATLSAVDPDTLINGYWTVLQGGSTITNPNEPTTEVTNLALGTNTFLWTQDYGCEVNQSITQIIVYDGTAPAANAGPDVFLCSNDNTYTMLANDPQFTATGTWEITQGTATIWNINDPNALVTNLGIGENKFEWNIDNGPCPGGPTFDPMSIFVFDQNHPPANAGVDQEFCSADFTETTLTGSTPIFPASGMWTLVSGSATMNDPSLPELTVTNAAVGVNVFEWTISNGPCGTYTDTVTLTIYDEDATVADAGDDASYCSPAPDHTMNAVEPIGPGFGTWTLVSGSGTLNNPNDALATVSNLGIGENVFQWSLFNGDCSQTGTTDQVTITVFDSSQTSAQAGPDQEFCLPDLTDVQLAANSVNPPATAMWSVAAGSGIFDDPSSPDAIVSGLSVGSNVFEWTIDNGACGLPSSDQIEVLVYDPNQAAAFAGIDTSFCSPISSYIMMATNPDFPSFGTWSLISGTGTISDVNDPNATIDALTIGDNVFRWTIGNGPCSGVPEFDDITITIFDPAGVPADAGDDQFFCFQGGTPVTATMSANSPTPPGTGGWSIVQGSGIIVSPSSPTTDVVGLAVGENILQWTLNNGSCDPSLTTDLVSIWVYDPTQTDADAGPDQGLCSNAAFTNLAGNAYIFPATGSWTLVQGSGFIDDPTDPNTSVTGLGLGENIFEWIIDNGPCLPGITSDQVSITVYDQTVQPANAGPDQSICSTTSSVTLQANFPTPPALGTWTLISGSGTITDPNNPQTTVTSMSVGELILEWTLENGACGGTTTDQVSIFVFDTNAPFADAGPDQENCTPDTDAIMAGNAPVFPSVGIWELISGAGIIADANDPNTAVSGLSIGENVFRWTVSNAPCSPGTTLDLVTIYVFDGGAASADAGADQEYCSPVSSTLMSANTAVFPAVGSWTLINGTGSFNNPNSPTTQVTGLSLGDNVFEWTISGGPCPGGVSSDQVTITIYDTTQEDASAGDDQSLCSPTDFTSLDGNAFTYPASGTWTLISGAGVIADASDPNSAVSSLAIGENVFQWSIDNGPCGTPTTDEVSIFVYDSTDIASDAGVDQELCLPINSAVLAANNPVFPAEGIWNVIQGAGTFVDPTDPTTAVNNLAVGDNIFEWVVDNNGCGLGTTSDQVTITLFTNTSPDAYAGGDQFLCTPNVDSFLEGNVPTFPATGLWTVVSGGGTIADPTDPESAVTAMPIGINVFEWTVSNGPCSNATTSDQVQIFVFDGGAPQPFAGDDVEICTPQTSVTMDADAAVSPGNGTWTIFAGTGTIADDMDPNTVISGLTVGTNTFVWTVDYSTCGLDRDTVNVVLFDSTLQPANAGLDQDFCLPTNSTNMGATAVADPAFGTWSIIQGNGVIQDANDPTTGILNLTIGENIFVWTVYNSTCSDPTLMTDTVSIFINDDTQPAADAGLDQIICSTTPSVFMDANAPVFPATGLWTVISGSGTFVDNTDPLTEVTSMAPGVNTFQWAIDNGSCPGGLTTDQVSIYVFDENHPPADAGPDQEFCTPVSSTNLSGSTFTAPTTGIWQLLIGNATIANPNDPNTLVTNLGVGENIFQWTIINGPCGGATSDVVSIFVYNQFNADADAGEDEEICTPQDFTSLEGNEPIFPAIGTWSVFAGGGTVDAPNNPNSGVSGLTVGENIFVWTVENGPCANALTTDTVSVFLFDEGASLADAGADQEFCVPTSTAFLSANTPDMPGLGTWTLVSGTGVITDPNDPNSEVTGLTLGENVFAWTIYNGPCALSNSVDEVSIFIFDNNQEDANAGTDQNICTPLISTYLDANELIFPATGAWTLIQGSATILNIADPNTFVNDLGLGDNVFVWAIDNGPCSGLSTDTVVVSLYDLNAPQADAGVDQEQCLPNDFAVMDANTPENAAEGTWEIVSGGGTIINPSSPGTVIVDIPVGENIFSWNIDNGDCGFSSDTVSVFIFDPQAALAYAGEDKEFCTPITSTTLNGNVPDAPGVGTWTLFQGAGTIADVNDPFTEVSNLAIGENIFCWSIDNGPCGEPSSDCVSIFVFDENAPDAFAGEDFEICLPLNSLNLNATPAVFPAFGTWSVISGSATILEPTNPNSFVTDLEIGTTELVWTVDNGPCVPEFSSDTLLIYVFEEDIAAPYAGDDLNLCTPQSSTFLNADDLEDPNTGTWELVSGNGVFIDPTDPQTEVVGLTVGTNVFVWNVYNGPCTNAMYSDTVIIAVFQTNLDQPDAGLDQELCLPLNSTTVQGSIPPPPAEVQWTLLSGAGTIVDPDNSLTDITDLEQGINVFVYSVANGPCMNILLADTMIISVFSEDALPANAGEDVSICTPESSVVLNATVPDIPGIGTWTIIQGGGTISDVNDPNATISALGVGETILQWTVYNGNCFNTNTFDFVSIFVFDATNDPADAGEDQEFCWPISSTTLDANLPTYPAVGSWAILTGTGNLSNPQDPNATLSTIGIGTHTLVWTVDNGPCGPLTQDTVQVFVFDPSSPVADAGEDQEFCTPFNGMQLNGSIPSPPATGVWTIISGSVDIQNPLLYNSAVNSLGLGANTLVWTVDNGACDNAITSDTLVLYLNDINVSSANAGPDQFFCGEVDSLQLAGSVTIGNTAFGYWTILNGGGDFDNVNNEASYVFDVPLGVNTYSWTVDNGFCGITSDTLQIVVYNPEAATAYAGEDLTVCDHEFSPFDLAANSADYPAVGYWTVEDGPIEISDDLDPETMVLDLGSITTPLESIPSTLIWYIDNGECGISSDTLLVTLEDCLTIDIPDAISPNGDGYNDYFVVPNLEEYPNNTLKIFNRWGALIYDASPYQNDWNGTSSHGNMMGSELPVSTYYYILDLGNGTEALTGYIYLKR